MGIFEIILLAAGVIVFTISFVLPEKFGDSNEAKPIAEEEIKAMVARELEGIRSHVDDVVNEAIEYAIEKTERSLERLTNEKIMAVNEYSDTVLAEIHKNHEEVMFMYDMLNSKQVNIKNTASEVDKTVKRAEETTRETEAATREAEAVVDSFKKLSPVQLELTEDGTAIKGVKEPETEHVEVQTEMVQAEAEVPAAKASGAKKKTTTGKPVQSEGVKVEKLDTATGRKKTTKTVKPATFEVVDREDVPAMNFMNPGAGENKNAKILELHRAGKSNVAIAKELGLGVGEVKLVLDLYKNM